MSERIKPVNLTATIVASALMLGAALAAQSFKPTQRLSETKPAINLAQQIPVTFGEWTEDVNMTPVLPNPEVQAKLDVLYSSTLARTYRNRAGQRVLLSIAYGSDQSSEATAVHRPEFCYSAQGFGVSNRGEAEFAVGSHSLRAQRLLAVLGNRREPITYWITLDETATLPGLDRKLAQLRYGLQGQIPDGLLFRVSTVGMPEAEGYALQERFVNDLAAHVAPVVAARYFGK